MHFFKILLIVTGAAVGAGGMMLSGSVTAELNMEGEAATGVVAPDGQLTFEEQFDVKLNLPMDEDEFIQLIEHLELNYKGQGPESVTIKNKQPGYLHPLNPRYTKNYDMSDISHSYMITANYNRAKCRVENYLALVRSDQMVVYVENQFNYAKGLIPYIC